jgi:Protein of unknown function (DUF3040)
MGGNVPLSEHEQRQLEQIEQSLYADYPRFAHAARRSDPRVHYKRRVVEAAFGFLLGIGMLLAGVVANIWIGVAGFVVMLACAMWAVSSWRHMTGNAAARTAAPGAADAPESGTVEGSGPAAGRRSTAGRRGSAGRGGGRGSAKERRSGRAHSPGFMERLEERWRRRQERDR